MSKVGALKAVYEASRPVALKARAMAQDIGQTLKGKLATGEQWYNQLKNTPGVKPAPLKAAYGHMAGSPIQLTKDQFLQSVVSPKLYTQRAHLKKLDASDHRHELALDIFFNDEGFYEGAINRQMDRLLDIQRRYPLINGEPVDLMDVAASDEGLALLRQTPEWQGALDRADNIVGGIAGDPHNVYPGVQTLDWRPRYPHLWGYSNAESPGQYFETVLRKNPKEGEALTNIMERAAPETYHFDNPGQIAHARGEYYPDVNSVFMHEIQSDPLEAMGKLKLRGTPGTEALSTPHGDMLKAALLNASRGGADRVVVPTGEMITNMRNPAYRNFYENVYDEQLSKEVYNPLEQLGIRIPSGYGGSRSIELTPEIRDNLNTYGLPFRKGGLAQACSWCK